MYLLSYNPSDDISSTKDDGWIAYGIRDRFDLARIVHGSRWSPIVWRAGVRRASNFESARYCVLDVDDGLSLKEAAGRLHDNGWAGYAATSKSHMREKNGVVSERFRIVMIFSQTITDCDLYKYNIERVIKIIGSDSSCKDAARFYWPSPGDLSVLNAVGGAVEVVPIVEKPMSSFEYRESIYRRHNPAWLPAHVRDFLDRGLLFGNGSRQTCCYISARHMRDSGVSADDALARLRAAPFDRNNFCDREIINAVSSAYKK